MPVVTVAHIVFDNSNDPGRVARRHVGREIGKGMKQTDIVSNAWQRRHAPVPNAITSTTWQAPPFTPVEIYYDPSVVDGASEQEVIDALIKPIVYLIAPAAVRAKIHDTFHISMTGLFAVLLIFVLAQIFRRGSDMRAELAGTI